MPKNYTHCFYKVSTVNKCERTFINVTYVVEKEKEDDDEKKYLNLSSCISKNWWRCICVQDKGRASINHFFATDFMQLLLYYL